MFKKTRHLKSVIEDMDEKQLEEMMQEAIDQGLIEQVGFKNGEPTFGLSSIGRKMVEASDLLKTIPQAIEKDFDADDQTGTCVD